MIDRSISFKYFIMYVYHIFCTCDSVDGCKIWYWFESISVSLSVGADRNLYTGYLFDCLSRNSMAESNSKSMLHLLKNLQIAVI